MNPEEQERQEMLNRLSALRGDIRKQQADVKAYLQTVADGGIADSPPKGFESIEQLRAMLNQMDALISRNEQILKDGKIRTDAIQDEMNEIVNMMVAAQARIGELHFQEIKQADEKLQAHFVNLDTRTAGLEKRATDIETTIKPLGQTRLIALLALILALLGAGIVFFLTQNTAIDGQISTLNAQIARANETASVLGVTVTALDGQRQNAESTLEALIAELTQSASESTAETTATPDPRIDKLEAELTQIATDVLELRQENTVEATAEVTVNAQIATLQAEITALQAQLTEVIQALTPTATPTSVFPMPVTNATPTLSLENRILTLEAMVTQLASAPNVAPAPEISPEASPEVSPEASPEVSPEVTEEVAPVRLQTIGNVNRRDLPTLEGSNITGTIASDSPVEPVAFSFPITDFIWFCVVSEEQYGWVAASTALQVSINGVDFATITITDDNRGTYETDLINAGLPASSECPPVPTSDNTSTQDTSPGG